VGKLLKLILDVSLDLEDSVGVIRVVNLRRYLVGLRVHSRLEEALCMVKLVRRDIREEFG
jgi:hypothetical protein